MKLGSYKQLFLPFAAGAALLLSAGVVLAAGEITPTLGTGGGTGGGEQQSSDDSKSVLRQWTWENSFDKAGDANADLEKSLSGEINYHCEQYQQPYEQNGQKWAANPQLFAECQRRQAAARTFKSDVSGIKKTQRVFAEVSRVSDAAAVASIGAAGYAEVWQKQKSQSSVFNSAASLEEKASIAAYTTGAADVSMGAWAYAQQKSKLEKIQQQLNGKSGGVSASSGNSQLNSRLAKAIEETKQAAYNHMLWGAGKVAAGYAGMKLAERTRQQAKNLESIEEYNALASGLNTTVSTVTASNTAQGSSVTMASNTPNFSLNTASSTSTVTASNTGGGAFSGGSSSMMPNSAFGSGISRTPASAGVSAPSGGSLSAGITPNEAEEKAAAEEEKATQEAVQKTAFGYGEYSRGGGAITSGGGAAAAAEKDDPAAALAGIAGNVAGNDKSVASLLNANQLADEASAGLDGSEQGSMAGVSSNRDRSLFETVKAKNTKALQAGNLVGPNTRIEIRN